MKTRILISTALLTSSLSVTGGAGAAEDPRRVFLTAPYTDAQTTSNCFDGAGLTGGCTAQTADADAATGAFDLRLHEQTRDAGSSVGAVLADASASFTAHHARITAAGALLVVATIRVDEVTTGVTEGLSSLLSLATVDAGMSVGHGACETCVVTVERAVSSSIEPGILGTISLLGVLVDPAGGPVPAGTIGVEVTIGSTARLAGIGEARAEIAGTLTQIEIAAPSAERVLAPPYLAADAARSCSGSIGTTFTCRSAAARSTGRIEMDLGVITPVAGTAPGSGSAVGTATLELDDTPAEPVRATIYIAELRITSADAFAQTPMPVIGAASAAIASLADVTGPCEACTRAAWAGIVDTAAGTSLLDETVPLVVWTRQDADAVAQDPVLMRIVLNGASFVQDSSGTALASLRATLSSVRTLEIA